MKRFLRLVLPALGLVPLWGCAHASHPVLSSGPSVKPPSYDQVIVVSGPDPILPVSPEAPVESGSEKTDGVSDWPVAPATPNVPAISDNTDPDYIEDEEDPATAGWVEGEPAGARMETVPSAGEAPVSPPLEPDFDDDPFREESPPPRLADPLEPLNRALFVFNDRAYFWVMKPVAQGYAAIVPETARVSVRNFFRNITMPVRFVNNLLQGKIRNSGVELLRFLINTTGGIGGLFDPAKNDFHIEPREEDLGQTLGAYGLGHGFYLVLPLIGPSSLRDATGLAGDFFLDPVNYVDDTEIVIGAKVFKAENEVSLRIGEYEDLVEAAIDPYVAVRDAYAQYRWNKVRDRESKAVTHPGPEK